MDPNLGSLVVTELVLSMIDELDSLEPGIRARLYERAINKAENADHVRVPDGVAALQAMRDGKIGT